MSARVFWLEHPALGSGRMATSPAPPGLARLPRALAAWRAAGVDHVVSLLPPDDAAELGLAEEAAGCRAEGMRFSSHPIGDLQVPDDGEAFRAVLGALLAEVRGGSTVLVHCFAGIGRSSLVVAGVMAEAGVELEAAWRAVAQARGVNVPETAEQGEWLRRLFAPG